jgi:hypothetical protein
VTLLQPPMMVHGGTHSARAMRLMLADLARGRQGIAEAEDLKVRPLENPGSAVRVADGSALIRGARPWQGAYSQTNAGDTTVQVPPTGPFSRTDLLVLRVEDPEYEGDRDPRTQDIGYFHLIPGVDMEETAVPPGMTAIPLARLTLPRNTSAITAEMITDLRQLAHPRCERSLHAFHPRHTQQLPHTQGEWAIWPHEVFFTLDVPAWATKAIVLTTVGGLRITGGGVHAQLRTAFGDKLRGAPTLIDDDQGTTAQRTITSVLADSFTLPPDYRSTHQRLFLQANPDDRHAAGELTAAPGTTVAADIEFAEGPL